jgi:uncharacterized protein
VWPLSPRGRGEKTTLPHCNDRTPQRRYNNRMGESETTYDPRYLGGVLFFNRHEFFEAHEVWEDLWQECAGPERRFVQGLIQAAVALYHFGNGNVRGAFKLFHSSRDYMAPYGSLYLGVDTIAFWQQMERCFAAVLNPAGADRSPPLDEQQIPIITLDPPPEQWPEPHEFLRDEE